ncbi:MAG: hypothetical protein JOZ68_16040 [Acidimicrobiia bacterium]|nr:hypothetical protein [Acidimicrobiia bacterium]MBV8986293.1 hypothetical protein [Acidimicrobiia bacterium]MBV9042514.1 hypothetical protein [Acidimicrobiia bacterium]
MTESALAAGATLVAVAFAMSTFERWLAGRRRHELAWASALALFAAGAVCLWVGVGTGWTIPVFRAFYLFGAIVNVPVLAVGTVYLLGGRGPGNRAALGVTAFAFFAAGVIISAPAHAIVDGTKLPQGSDIFEALPRVLAAVASGGGALVVLGGAAWSAWKLRSTQRQRMWANVVIAAGTLVLGASGLLNSVLGQMEAFAVTLAVGVSVLYAGFLLAVRTPRPRARPAAPAAAPSRPDLVESGPRS